MNDNSIRGIIRAGALALTGMLFAPAIVAQGTGAEIIRTHCLACHSEQGGAVSRISEQRKSPEGWHMTLNRMEHRLAVKLSPTDKRAVIKHLADTQGLAPSEAQPYRYLLEQDTNLVENIPEAYVEMCARCHSGARFGLQRRSEEEWRLLVHFHLGQYPTLELHALSRDRPWMHLAMTKTVPQLAADYPLDSDAWKSWQGAPKPELGGQWRMIGYMPGKGEFDARMTAVRTAPDHFRLNVEGRYADGSLLRGEGNATVYTGYEWRATLNLDGLHMRQVLAASADGAKMTGRQFMRDAREIGGAVNAVKEGTGSRVLAVMPSHLRLGETGTVTIVGNRLSGRVSLGEGVRVVEELSRSADRITVRARATGAVGMRDVAVGQARGAGLLAVYGQVARIEVMPENAVARVGGPGDAQMEKVRVAYRAVAYAAGADGQADLRLGYMPVSWGIEPADEYAAEAEDHLYAGSIDANGVFTPGDAGPNPQRFMSGGNTGRLSVVATVADGAQPVEGRANLLVAVPDFVRRVLD